MFLYKAAEPVFRVPQSLHLNSAMSQYNNDIQWYTLVTAPLFVWIAAFFLSTTLVRSRARRAYLFAQGWYSSAQFLRVMILLSVCICMNTLALVLNRRDRGEVARYSGMLATVAFAILLAGANLDITAAIQGGPLRSHIRVHRWLSFITLWTATLHILLSIINSGVSWTYTETWGFAVGTLSLVRLRLIEQKISRPCSHSEAPLS